ncbi:MAG: hypothetical protein ACRC7G_16960, partial [Beijerinckiaceae bacterium]
DRGAALALFRVDSNRIVPLAESPAIGTRNRWLNPLGVADFLGDGSRTIAAVVTPHLAGSLRLYRLAGQALTEVARIDGYTNHIIGSRDLDLGHVVARTGIGAAHIVIPTLDRRAVAVVSLEAGRPHELQRFELPRRVTAMAKPAGRKIDVRLDDGSSRTLTFSG